MGVGEASGMFPIENGNYNKKMLDTFRSLVKDKVPWDILDILPTIKTAGENCGTLTDEGAAFIDEDGEFKAGIPFCAPEGDAGTGMVATNAVLKGVGNVSAGTSIFAMLVLKNKLKNVYEEIDVVTTPAGDDVAMVHCNNCCGELDAFVNMFGEFARLIGANTDKSTLYNTLYKNTVNADEDCGGITAYNYLSGEHITGIKKGSPMYFRTVDSKMNLANFMKSLLYSSVASLSLGMEILFKKEKAQADRFLAHGGLFKVEGVAQQILSDALNTPVSVMETAGEGGAFGMALLAAYMVNGNEPLGQWLNDKVFSRLASKEVTPSREGVKGFKTYIKRYKAGLSAEKELEKI